MAQRLAMSPNKISRIETGNSGLQIEDLASRTSPCCWASTRCPRPPATSCSTWSAAPRNAAGGPRPGLPQLWPSLIDFEAKATRVQNYEALVVPLPLQTAEYTRAIIQGVAPTVSEAELDNLVAARMARQAVLSRARAPQFFAVVDEGALRRAVGEPGVMHRQLHSPLPMAPSQRATPSTPPAAL